MKKICCLGSTAVLLCVLASNSASQGNPGLVIKQRERYTRSIALEFTRKNRNVAERALSVLADVGPNAYASGFLVGVTRATPAGNAQADQYSSKKR